MHEFTILQQATHIYELNIRSMLEKSCQVWNFSVSEEEKQDLERVQKVACKIILKDDFETYKLALEKEGR